MLEALANAIGQEKASRCIRIGKQEIKTFLITDDMNIYLERPKELEKLLKIMRTLSSSKYKINLQKQSS